MTDHRRKPGRTIGLSLAIIASVILFTVLPLLQLMRLTTLRANLEAYNRQPGVQPLAMGIDYVDVSEAETLVRALLGLIFFGIAVFAWRGKPPAIRFVMVGAVLALTGVTIAIILQPLFAPPSIQSGIDSGYTVRRTLLGTQLIFVILVPLYVVWYLNRAPARAFYRGYYLPDPAATALSDSPDHRV